MSATPRNDAFTEFCRGIDDASHLVALCKFSEELERENFELRDHLETERCRLAAVSVVACADTRSSRDEARRMLDVYRSGSLSDVERRVDECILLREHRDMLFEALEEVVLYSHNCRRGTMLKAMDALAAVKGATS